MIGIDISGLIPAELLGALSQEAIETLLDDVANSARAKWIRIAQNELNTTSRDYIQGIQEIESKERERVIALVGWLPNAIENGISSYDLRKTLLGEGKGKTSKDGHRYRSIPFRHRAGGAMGAGMGPAGGASLRKPGGLSTPQAQTFGRALHRMAKRLEGGQSLNQLPSSIKKAGAQAEAKAKSFYMGMRKLSQPTKGGGSQSQYQTFRTISERISTGWIHPGIQARNFTDQVTDHIIRVVPAALDAILKNATKR